MATERVPQKRTRKTKEDDLRVSMARGEGVVRERRPIRTIIVALVIAAVLLVSALVGFLVLASTPAFTIASIDAEATEHLTADNIAKLADVAEGTTLLTIDETAIAENLKRNPWVSEVQFVREFPDRLKIVVIERKVDCVVKMSSGSVCWCLGDDYVWIEPVNITPLGSQSVDDAALALAREMNAILITDAPTSMSPSAGSVATDEVLMAIQMYREQFSPEFSEQIVCFGASSVESISCTLSSGVEVSLGSPNSIATKEAVILEILARHPNQITYINVRVPSQPSYRKLGTESVEQGSGVTVDEDAYQVEEVSGSDAETTDDAEEADGESGDVQYDEWGNPIDDGYTTDGYSDYDDGSSEEYILGEDGNYYSYEDYYGLN